MTGPYGLADHAEAFTVALSAVDDALNGAGQPGDCLHCLGHAVTVADYLLHEGLLRAARAAEYLALGHAPRRRRLPPRAASPPGGTEPGAYRGQRLPLFLDQADVGRWLSRPARKRCKLCGL